MIMIMMMMMMMMMIADFTILSADPRSQAAYLSIPSPPYLTDSPLTSD